VTGNIPPSLVLAGLFNFTNSVGTRWIAARIGLDANLAQPLSSHFSGAVEGDTPGAASLSLGAFLAVFLEDAPLVLPSPWAGTGFGGLSWDFSKTIISFVCSFYCPLLFQGSASTSLHITPSSLDFNATLPPVKIGNLLYVQLESSASTIGPLCRVLVKPGTFEVILRGYVQVGKLFGESA